MRRKEIVGVLLSCAIANCALATPPIELELATESGLQITAPHEWLQLLTSIGITNVRIRAAEAGDQPRVENRGTNERPLHYVAGILTSQNQLRLPGGTFTRGDRQRIKDYFERLAADGGESLTAARGLFGLTEKEIDAVFSDLTQPIDFETKGQQPTTILERLRGDLALRLDVSADAERALRGAASLDDDFNGLTAGTSLAIVLRGCGLVFRPEKPRGQPVVYRVGRPATDSTTKSTLGDPSAAALPCWPIGWQLQRPPGQTAPTLFEYLNAEIDGYTLAEALAAIGPRLKVPIYFDHVRLAEQQIDPSKIEVRMARTRTYYKRVLDRVLAQAHLGSQLRLDEAGKPFLWITR